MKMFKMTAGGGQALLSSKQSAWKKALLYILMPVFCVALCAGAVFSFLNSDKTVANAVSSTPTVNIDKAYLLQMAKATNTDINYDTNIANGEPVSGEVDSTLTSELVDNSIKVTETATTQNLYSAFSFIEFTAGYTVPARTQYEFQLKLDASVLKTTSYGNQSSIYIEVFEFGITGTEECGTPQGIIFSPIGSKTSNSGGSAYLKASKNGTGKTYSVDYTTESIVFENRTNEDKFMSVSFGVRLSISAGSSNKYLFSGACDITAPSFKSTDLWFKLPTDVSTAYTGTEYNDTNLNTIAEITSAEWYDSTKMDLSLQEGTAQNVGNYSLDVSLKNTEFEDNPWKLDDGTFSHEKQTVTLQITKINPLVNFGNASSTTHYTVKGTQDEFPEATTNVGGTLSWGDQLPEGDSEGKRKEYSWTFTPDDTINYNTLTDKISLNFITPGIETVTATFNSNGAAVYVSTPAATRNKYFKVMVKYHGMEQEQEVEAFSVLGWTSGKNVPVTIMVGSSISESVIVPEIGIDKIESLTAFINQGNTKITCETSDDTIKGLLQVIAKWNYANSTVALSADDYKIDFTPVVGTNTSTLKVKYENSDGTEVSATPTGTIVVSKADYSIDDSVFADKTATYTGKAYDPTGWIDTTQLPEGMTVTYSCDDWITVGKHEVTATFSNPDPDNYNDPAKKTATLTISDKPVYDESGLEFKADGAQGSGNIFTATYSPEKKIEIEISGKLKDKNGAEVVPVVSYEYKKQVNGAWETVTEIKGAGTYQIVAKISTGDSGYADINDRTATLTISKADVDMTGVTYGNDTVVYDGAAHTLTVTGTLPATPKITVTYSVKGENVTSFTEAGTYEFTAKFTHDDTDNYNEIADMTATLTISEATITGISAEVAEGIKLNVTDTLDYLKKFVSVTVNYTGNGSEPAEDFTLYSATLRDGGFLEVGEQEIIVTYTDADGKEYKTTFKVTVEKAKVALPVYKGTLSYTGAELKPTANDFDGYNAEIMSFVESKTVAGLNAGTYKAVFALNDPDRYEWASATTLKKSVFAAVVYDGEISIDPAYEAAVEWNIAKAVITAETGADGKPVFKSEGITGAALAQAVGLKYYKDAACTQEVSADELEYETTYYMQAELLDSTNFALDNTVTEVVSVPYTTPAKELTVWDKIVNFLKANWLWLVIAVVALILLITIIACAVHASRKKRIREERRLAEEKAERERKEEREREERRLEREERMARMNQPQAAPQPQYIPQPMPQMQPQYMPQAMPQQVQPMTMPVGGAVDSAQITRIETELATLKAAQAARDMAEIKAEQAAIRSDISTLRGVEQVGGISVDAMTEIMTMALKNVLASATQQVIASQPVQQAQLTEGTGNAPATQVPPDAVMTTVTTTKIDTTKKSGQGSAQSSRPIVRNYVAPMPVDDGRVFDVGGFYKPADPLTDISFDNEDKKD